MRTCGDYTPLIATWVVSLDFIIGAASPVPIVTSGYVDDFMQDTGSGISNTCTVWKSQHNFRLHTTTTVTSTHNPISNALLINILGWNYACKYLTECEIK